MTSLESLTSVKGRDMRLLLQEELAARCAQNAKYSLRAFAKFLSVSPAALSALLNGKRPITNKMKDRLGLKLGYSIVELGKIKVKTRGNTKSLRGGAEAEHSYKQITVDIFNVVAEPFHYAILELMKTHDFRPDNPWIATRLGLTVSQVNIGMERLERVGLLSRSEDGLIVDVTGGFSSDLREGLSSEAQRRFQISSLKAAAEAVENVSVDNRDNTSMTMAVATVDLPKARAMIKEFRRRFCQTLESVPRLDQVYQLTISFTPISKSRS